MNPRPDLQAITRELCEVARKNMPGAFEFIYHDAVGSSVSKSPFDRICYIAPQKAYVNFGFFFGVGMQEIRPLVNSLRRHGRKRLDQSQESMPGAKK